MAPRNKEMMQSRKLAKAAAQLAEDRHCRDIVVLEVASFSPVARHFVIATGTSEQQLRSIGHELIDLAKEMGFNAFGRAGLHQGRWVVLDFVDVVVHLFDEEFRRFYDLEMLWGDAPKVRWRRKNTPKAPLE